MFRERTHIALLFGGDAKQLIAELRGYTMRAA
jgi:hypothetical protein